MELKKIAEWLNKYLDIEGIEDGSWNGLQVEGSDDVKKVALIVDSGIEPFKRCIDSGADLIIVHHGLFWKSADPSITRANKKKVKMLLNNNTSLYCAHLPLDRHRELGNNSQLLRVIGAKIKEEFLIEDKNISWIGEFDDEKEIKEIKEKLDKEIGNEVSKESRLLNFGKNKIERVGVCSGSASTSDFYKGVNKKVDLYITGEETDLYQQAKDNNINVIFGGHHATETLCVKALAEKISNKFQLETEFIDLPTGL